jgi:hypothetical protein
VTQKEIKFGDIINMYSREHFSSLRKDPTVNNRLLMQLELSNGITMGALGQDCSGAIIDLPEDDGIEFENSEDEGGETAIVGAAPAEEKDVHLDEL